ncbi:AraC family transcriptional regulator [Paenibacillus sp. HWE-109]|uniref:AraC family transcriptional regulator n=1 Tax=Paenibacillus sp. HWE-109 TaxID=1306526 RepID=UPI001EE150D2|nr:AraC family transcriptional regulator [Paenibacillus sp. HWE-109]UKS30997.1 AraC family transcriptional regulator [Paenibacillus sp. HWE-109]
MNRNIIDELSEYVELRLGSIGTASHDKGWTEAKQHPDYDIWLVTNGEVEVDVQGVMSVAKEGDIVFFNPGVAYTASCSQNSCSHIFVHFDFSLGERFNFLNEFDLMGVISGACLTKERELFREAFNAYQNRETMASLMLKGFFLALLARLLSIPKHPPIGLQGAELHSKHFTKLVPVLAYIEAHIGERIAVEQLAEMSGMSPKYFYAFFKAQMGVTPQNYMTRLKLNRAREYLYEGKLTVKQIAYQLGFADPYTFSKIFKRFHKIAPSKYYGHT